ncbi:hypothetical protein AGMMS50239_18240 [Bacteroidia bacterium]|nr:hypothetical protein AGMMS50239_18240 [Bacteroidia bacterium]
MYDNAKEFASGETIYPGKFDFAKGSVGFDRVEIDLLKAGRVPSSQIKLGRAKKTVVEYDDQVMVIDSVCSWVNATGLTKSKLYQFTIYTIDDLGNKSVPVEVNLTPFTSTDLDATDVNTPRITVEPLTSSATSSAASFEWPSGISSQMMDCDGFSYEYTDRSGTVKSGELTAPDNRLNVSNLAIGAAVEIKITYHGWPKIGGVRILDKVNKERTIVVNTPSADSRFYPAEEPMLRANGIANFTLNGVAGIEKLIFSPGTLTTLEDVVYFPSLKEIDLTGEGINFPIQTYTFPSTLISGVKTGGCNWIPFLQRHTAPLVGGLPALKDLLDAGQITRIRYYPNSLGGMDAFLAPYVATGIVELADYPDEILAPHALITDPSVQNLLSGTVTTFPATDAPAEVGLENIYKIKFKRGTPAFLLAFPLEYQINLQEYKYLKMKIYPPALSKIDKWGPVHKTFTPYIMNRLWTAGYDPSPYAQQLYTAPATIFTDAQMETWVDITIDLSSGASSHWRVFWLAFYTAETNVTEDDNVVYYISNVRFTK